MRQFINLKEKKVEKRFKKFINEVSKLEVSDFLGLIRILNITAINEDKKPKDFDCILEEVLDKFLKLSNNAQKNLLSILEAANREKKRGGNFGTTAKDTKK
jgi:hypothetical protein